MNLGIIAHNSKKVLIEDFCIAYKNILAKHEVYATGTTGRRIEEATSLHVHKFLAGSIGGDKQFMEMVERQDHALQRRQSLDRGVQLAFRLGTRVRGGEVETIADVVEQGQPVRVPGRLGQRDALALQMPLGHGIGHLPDP